MTRRATRRAETLPWVASVVHLIVAPGVVVGLLPWLITGWQAGSRAEYLWPLRAAGLVVTLIAAMVIVAEFVRFARAGGSPAPVVPTSQLVVAGLYRHVRNPMYVAVVTGILGQAMWFMSLALVGYAVVMAAGMTAFVRWYEEPALSRQHGSSYDRYRAGVPAWIPRLHAADITQPPAPNTGYRANDAS